MSLNLLMLNKYICLIEYAVNTQIIFAFKDRIQSKEIRCGELASL